MTDTPPEPTQLVSSQASNSQAAVAPSDARAAPWMVLALIVAAFVGGAGTLWGGWVGDDAALVRDADAAQSLSRAVASPAYPAPQEPGAYRPVTLASFALTASGATATAPRDPIADHVANVLLHVLATWLLFCVLKGVTRSAWIGLGGALVFAVHPLHVATIASLAGRADLLALVFGCTTTLAWLAVRRGHMALVPAMALSYLLAIGSHEIALGLPFLLLLLPRATNERSSWLPALAFLPALILYAIGGAGRSTFDLPFERVWSAFAAIGRGTLSWIVPVRLAPEHVFALDVPGQSAVLLGWAVGALYLFGWIRIFLGRAGWATRAWVGGCSLVLIAAVVSAKTAPFGLSIGYVFTAALALVLGVVVRSLMARATLRAAVAGLAGIAALALLCVNETPHWRSEEARFLRRMALNHEDHAGQEAFARHLRQESDFERTRASQLRAEAPERGDALRRRKALLERAMAWSARAIEGGGRTRAAAWRERGLVFAAQQRWAEALPALTHAASLDKRLTNLDTHKADIARGALADAAEMFFAIGSAHEALGQRDDAADPYQFASQLDPSNVRYLRRAGQALTRAGQYREGLPLLHQAFQRAKTREDRDLIAGIIESEERAASKMAGKFLRDAKAAKAEGNYRVAVREFERALDVNDKLVEAMIEVGYLRGWYFGNYAQGYAQLARAERVLRAQDPNDPRLADVAKFRKALQKHEQEDNAALSKEEPLEKQD